MKQAAGETDPDKQTALYEQAQTLLMGDAPVLPLRWTTVTYEIQPYVGGIVVGVNDSQLPGDANFETIQILKH
jgi:ABC-type transport system substrate-binding protein